MEEKLKKAVLLGMRTVENGGEISRAEETVYRLCKACGAKEINIFIIPSLISVSATINSKEITISRRIYKKDLNLGALEEINSISRKLCGEKTANSKIFYRYNIIFTIFGIMLATGAFCIFFGGSFTDALFSAIAGNIIHFLPYSKKNYNVFSRTLIEATAAGILSFIPSIAGLPTHPDKIMIGTIMLLVPGMSIGAAMRDLMGGNPIAGILEFTEAIITALAIVLGFSISLILFGGTYIA